MIDSHCHLAGPEFVDDLDAVVARAKAAGLARVLVILGAEDEAELARAEVVGSAWPTAKFAVGVHPHHAGVFAADPSAVSELLEVRLRSRSTVAIGEIGLDYFYDHAPREVQQAVFRVQLQFALAHRLPVVLHVRDAEADALAMISETPAAERRGVFHCFTGPPDAAERALATGFFLSFPGILTFPKADTLREAARLTPLDRILIETDSPFLAPVPHRGKRNEPAHVLAVRDRLAELRGLAPDVLDAQLLKNFDSLFTA